MEDRFKEFRDSLTIDQVFHLVAELGGDPRQGKDNEHFVSRTICHNSNGKGSYKLYYYNNSHMFHCFTECSPETFDIYELVKKIFSRQNAAWTLNHAVKYVYSYFNESFFADDFEKTQEELQDWKILNKYTEITKLHNKEKQKVEMKFYDEKILAHLPQPHILPWEEEGILYEVTKARNIKYNPSSHGIVIPHYDMNNNLIGIRERTLIKEEEQYGKYKPAIFNGVMYNHPLGFSLYNLNFSKENIKKMKIAIVTEGEKNCLKYASYFGVDNDISVAVCGSNLISHQVELLLSLGVKELAIAFDKQFEDVNSEEGKKWIKKLKDIHAKYSTKCQISFVFDKQNLLNYKDSPLDQGAEIFLELFKKRIIL